MGVIQVRRLFIIGILYILSFPFLSDISWSMNQTDEGIAISQPTQSTSAEGTKKKLDIPQVVPEQFVVRFKTGASASTLPISVIAILGIQDSKTIDEKMGVELITLLPGSDVNKALSYFMTDPNVLYAEPNFINETPELSDDSREHNLKKL